MKDTKVDVIKICSAVIFVHSTIIAVHGLVLYIKQFQDWVELKTPGGYKDNVISIDRED